MAPCVVLLCSLFGLLLGQGVEQISIEDCCRDGQKHGNDNEECASLPLISGSNTCRTVQEQCCVTVLEDNMCTTGINVAKGQGACESLFTNTCETKTTKMCCDCCLLGKATQEQGLPCDHNLSVGYQCGLVSRACCMDGAPDNQTTPREKTELPNKDETNDNGNNSVLSDQCKGKCAHNCVGNGTCSCFKGYKLKPDGKSCEDINECLLGASNCRGGERCINTEGSFRCQREVSCGTGYELTDNNNCKDIDECKGPEKVCTGHGCINMIGSYRCECETGYIFNSISRVCEDINECRHYPGRLCAHKCENTLGSYQCSCTTGFKLAADGRNCDDLNECGSNPCSQECANVYGSYQCYCRRGYQLSDIDGMTCEDIDECALPTGGHICTYRCHNTPGSFHCSCPVSGYTLAPNGRSCQDIDECLTGTHTCTVNQSCFNVQGGFRCLLFECPNNYRRVGENRCERLLCNDSVDCPALPLRITYYYLTFPTNIPVLTNIFRMGPSHTVAGDDIQIVITSGNEGGFFKTEQVPTGGVMSVAKLINQPQDFELSLELRLRRYGTLSTYLAKVLVFVTQEEPRVPYNALLE
ncbi:fibulin-1 isoform X2 [Etheostoma cragini]|uniref:fibulin-1 isoform X2 n=1 Tax=Etheostoma cragini TaxID=417921 RepID=UPI00155E707B|nr:fibulin-1 isoform X2 [Etheostoma cragini]